MKMLKLIPAVAGFSRNHLDEMMSNRLPVFINPQAIASIETIKYQPDPKPSVFHSSARPVRITLLNGHSFNVDGDADEIAIAFGLLK
jgi:hypothetical protein